MKVHHHIDNFKASNPVLTIGTFDGVHLGHRMVLNQLSQIARNIHGESVLFTFYPHPRLILHPDQSGLRLITSLQEKIDLVEEAGVDHMVIYPFDVHFASLTYIQFIEQILLSKMNIHTLVIGHDHKLGRNREGTYENILKYSAGKSFNVQRMEKLSLSDTGISSSKIRAALMSGDIDKANHFLGYPYRIRGKVARGKRIGRSIGFPTANIEAGDEYKLIPKCGVYAITASVGQQEYKGMLNIGYRPTVNTQTDHRTIEVHLFDFDEDIYEREILVRLRARVRDEIKFSSLEKLKEQLEKDKQQVRYALDSGLNLV